MAVYCSNIKNEDSLLIWVILGSKVRRMSAVLQMVNCLIINADSKLNEKC